MAKIFLFFETVTCANKSRVISGVRDGRISCGLEVLFISLVVSSLMLIISKLRGIVSSLMLIVSKLRGIISSLSVVSVIVSLLRCDVYLLRAVVS